MTELPMESNQNSPVDDETRFELIRMVEALLFASAKPLKEDDLQVRMPDGVDVVDILADLQEMYRPRGVNLVRIAGGWGFRTAADLAGRLKMETTVARKLSRAAIETMAIIAYHQPVTRAEVEEIRGVALSKGTLDILLEAGWIQPRGRRRTPGRPLTWGTTQAFLDHFGLQSVEDLPGLEELKATGMLERRDGMTSIAMQQSDLLGDDDEEDEDGEDDDQLDFMSDEDDMDEDIDGEEENQP